MDIPVPLRHGRRDVATNRDRQEVLVASDSYYDQHWLLNARIPDGDDLQHEPDPKLDAVRGQETREVP